MADHNTHHIAICFELLFQPESVTFFKHLMWSKCTAAFFDFFFFFTMAQHMSSEGKMLDKGHGSGHNLWLQLIGKTW